MEPPSDIGNIWYWIPLWASLFWASEHHFSFRFQKIGSPESPLILGFLSIAFQFQKREPSVFPTIIFRGAVFVFPYTKWNRNPEDSPCSTWKEIQMAYPNKRSEILRIPMLKLNGTPYWHWREFLRASMFFNFKGDALWIAFRFQGGPFGLPLVPEGSIWMPFNFIKGRISVSFHFQSGASFWFQKDLFWKQYQRVDPLDFLPISKGGFFEFFPNLVPWNKGLRGSYLFFPQLGSLEQGP